jgi:hypothetical protein
VDERTYAAIVLAVMATTLVTPPVLKWRLTRMERRGASMLSEGGTLATSGD